MLFLQACDDHTEFLCEEADPSNQKACTDLPMSMSGDINNRGTGSHHRVASHTLKLLLDHRQRVCYRLAKYWNNATADLCCHTD